MRSAMVGASMTALRVCVGCVMGSIVHSLFDWRVPCMMMRPFGLKMYSLCCLNSAVHPASQRVLIEMSDPDAK